MPAPITRAQLFFSSRVPREAHGFGLIAESTLTHLGITGPVEIGIRFLGPRAMARLNRTYRGKDGATDTISFALEEAPGFIRPPDQKTRFLGDIYLCVQVIRQNSRPRKHTYATELEFVFIHSLLHLLGHDHPDANAQDEMDRLTEGILKLSRDGGDLEKKN